MLSIHDVRRIVLADKGHCTDTSWFEFRITAREGVTSIRLFMNTESDLRRDINRIIGLFMEPPQGDPPVEAKPTDDPLPEGRAT
jgi:hypothetical protein